mgnify:FL=1
MDYRELSRIGGDPDSVRRTARMVKGMLGQQITDWQDDFLSSLERFEGPDRLSTRQCETLLALRDQANRRKSVGGYRAAMLVRQLWELRFDLDYEDEERVAKLHEMGPDLALSDHQWRYIFALCRQNQIIDNPYIPLD